MTQKPNDDEASFEGLISFDSVPPGRGSSGDLTSDVHNARTTVAELPDSFLDSLKVGEVSAAHAPRPVAPVPELLAKTTVFVDFGGPPGDLESAFASALETPTPPPGPAPAPLAPLYQQPYPSPAAEFAPHFPAPQPSYVAPGLLVPSEPPPLATRRFSRLRAFRWQHALVALAALLLGFGLALGLRVLLAHLRG